MKTLKECLDEALLNGMLGYFMGWDEKHGPTLEEIESFERFFGGSAESLFLKASEDVFDKQIDIYTGPHGNAVIVHADNAWGIDMNYWSLWQSVATRQIAWGECEKAGLSVERIEIPAL